MIVLKHNDNVAFIYKSPEQIYKYDGGTDSSALPSTYIRFLVDICESVFISFPNDFKVNPELTNPFKQAENPGYEYEEYIVIPDEKVLLKEIPLAHERWDSHDLSSTVSSPDYSKFLSNIVVSKEITQESRKFTYYSKDIFGWSSGSSYGYSKLYTY